mmetsp:Transcript_55988/g.162308  ORF Transcript_55988/g.162308 Transcript_55988/m.162308 type:complete len:223 (-) Transcript_55988:100-768(-)
MSDSGAVLPAGPSSATIVSTFSSTPALKFTSLCKPQTLSCWKRCTTGPCRCPSCSRLPMKNEKDTDGKASSNCSALHFNAKRPKPLAFLKFAPRRLLLTSLACMISWNSCGLWPSNSTWKGGETNCLSKPSNFLASMFQSQTSTGPYLPCLFSPCFRMNSRLFFSGNSLMTGSGSHGGGAALPPSLSKLVGAASAGGRGISAPKPSEQRTTSKGPSGTRATF